MLVGWISQEFTPAGDVFGLGNCICAFKVAVFPFLNSICLYSMGLERVHPKHKVKELVGESSVVFESSNAVVQFLEGTVQEK